MRKQHLEKQIISLVTNDLQKQQDSLAKNIKIVQAQQTRQEQIEAGLKASIEASNHTLAEDLKA